jgi:protein SCO1/2
MPERDREHHGIQTSAVLGALGALLVVIVIVGGVARGLAVWWETPVEGANAPMSVRIEGPALESAPQYDRSRYFAGKDELLRSYGWLDRAGGIARIPIDEAMKIMAGERLAPTPPAETPPDAKKDGTGALPPQSPRSAEHTLEAAKVVQRTGMRLPLDALITNENGEVRALADYFGRSPVVLVFGYYRCRTLCTTMMEGVLQALSATGLDRNDYQVLGMSIDPRETSRDAADKARLYRTAYEDLPLRLFTSDAADTRRLSDAAGVQCAYDSAADQYAHPLALVVVAPDGRISRYFPGVQFDARALRLAIVEASEGGVGTVTDRVFLRCAHFDPRTGRYTFAALAFVRGGGLLVLLTLVASALWWRSKRVGH